MFVDHRNIPVCASGTLLQTVHTQLGKLWHAAPYIKHCLAIEYLGSMFDTKSGRASSRGGVFVPKCITCNISMFFDVPETTTALLFQAWNQAQTDVTPDFWTSEY